MSPYQFEVNEKAGGPLENLLAGPRQPDWRWMGYQELLTWQRAAQSSYVVRPYYAHLGSLDQVFTPVNGDLSTATAVMLRHIPYPHDLLPYPKRSGLTRRGLTRALNLRLPVVVTNLVSIGTAAIVDTGDELPGIDLLPEPMRWENPVRTDRHRVLPGLRRRFGRERNLPSGAPLKPVMLPAPDQSYFVPLAVDPATAAKVLTPALLKLTRDLQVAWWSEGTVLFVWIHEALPLSSRPQLAERARRIHREILAGQRQVRSR